MARVLAAVTDFADFKSKVFQIFARIFEAALGSPGICEKSLSFLEAGVIKAALLVSKICPRGFKCFLAFQIKDAIHFEIAKLRLGRPAFHSTISEGTLSQSFVFVIVLAADLMVLVV